MSVEHLKAKQAIIDEIKGKLEKAQSCVIVDYMGITVEEADGMRKKLREADVDYTVYKILLLKELLTELNMRIWRRCLKVRVL